jgi:putative FmdB family regulatory protein
VLTPAPIAEDHVPTYQYVCTDCATDLEAVQSFSDPSLTDCPTCGGKLRKRFGAVGVVFKGSGFYRNDSRADGPHGPAERKAEGAEKSAKVDAGDSGATGSGDKTAKSEPKADSSGGGTGGGAGGKDSKSDGGKAKSPAGSSSGSGSSSSNTKASSAA